MNKTVEIRFCFEEKFLRKWLQDYREEFLDYEYEEDSLGDIVDFLQDYYPTLQQFLNEYEEGIISEYAEITD